MNPGQIQLQESVMKLRFRLLHEEDLPRFLDALGRHGVGFFTVEQCAMRRLRPGDVDRTLWRSPISPRNATCAGSRSNRRPVGEEG